MNETVKKKKVGAKVLGLSLLSLLLVSGGVSLLLLSGEKESEKTADVNPSTIEGEKEVSADIGKIKARGIRFLSIQENKEARTSTVHYEIDPPKLSGLDFDCSLSWESNYDENYESPTWKDGKDPSTYITYAFDKEAHDITFACHDNFGWSILFTMVCKDNPGVMATLNLECYRKLKTSGYLEFVHDGALIEGEKFSTIQHESEYYPGTKPAEEAVLYDTFELFYREDYADDEGETQTRYESDLFYLSSGDKGYGENVLVDGVYKTNEQAAEVIQAKVDNYFTEYFKGNTEYHKADLYACFDYQYQEGTNADGSPRLLPGKDFLRNFAVSYTDYEEKDGNCYQVRASSSITGAVVWHDLALNLDLTDVAEVHSAEAEIVF